MHLNGSTNGNSSLHHTDSDQEHQIDFYKILNTLLIRKWLLISVTLLFGIGAMIISLFLMPIYEARGTLLISQNQNRYSYAGSDLSSLLTTTYGIGVGSTIANEMEVLRSITQSFEVSKRILEKETDSQGRKYPILWSEYPKDSTTAGIDTVASRYRKAINFEKVKLADIVGITFQSPSPTEAADIINLTMDAYSALSTDQNRTMAVSALSFLRDEKERIEQDLYIAEDSLKDFMNSTDLIAVNPQTERLIQNITDVEKQRQTIEVKLVAIESAISQYEKQINTIKPGLAEQYSEALGPIIQRFQVRMAELETERLMYKVKNPSISDRDQEYKSITSEIAQIKAQITSLTEKLLTSDSNYNLSFIEGGSVTGRISQLTTALLDLNVEKVQFETQLDVLSKYNQQLDKSFQALPDDMIMLSRLQRNVKINEQLFLLVANQYAEMSLWEKTQFGMGRTIDDALPPRSPVSPRKKLITLFGLFIGGLLSTGFILISDFVNDKIKSTDTLKEFKLPVLGTIPDFSILNGLDPKERQIIDNKSISNQLITFLDHISPLSEAYRRLRINVVFANPDKHYKVIMVTSATKGEGKSTVAANLAVTFSEAEKSVLIIDLDLRRPTQHKIFGEHKEPGLTDSLFETVDLNDIVRSTIAPNVDLMTVGKKTPEPATVLDSKRLKQLIDKLAAKYDHVILDTAPYGIISDSASLLRLVDGLVIVSRFNVTTKKELNFTLEGLRHLKADVLGIVMNAFDPKQSTDYYTNYAYYKRTYSEYYQEKT